MLLGNRLRSRSSLAQQFFQVRGKELTQNRSFAILLPGHLRSRLMMAEIFQAEREPLTVSESHNVTELFHIVGLAVGGQSHYLVFIPKLPKSQVLAPRP